MKQFTTIICCVLFAAAGAFLALRDVSISNAQRAAAANPAPIYLDVRNKLPLDLQLDLDRRLSYESPTIRDSVNIIDSVRWVTKTKWKTRYKNVADRTTARKAGISLSTVARPDSMVMNPAITSMVGREEQPTDVVDTAKVSSIQLTVDGKVVYSKNVNHSVEGGQ